MLLNEITCNLFYTSDQSAAGVKEPKVRFWLLSVGNVSFWLLLVEMPKLKFSWRFVIFRWRFSTLSTWRRISISMLPPEYSLMKDCDSKIFNKCKQTFFSARSAFQPLFSLLVVAARGNWSSVHGQCTWRKQSGHWSLQSVYKNYHPCHNPSGGLCQKTAYVLRGVCEIHWFIRNIKKGK